MCIRDRPLGALDKNLRESMQYEIKHIHESIGVTVVYVTHDQSEALTMSNRIAVFNDGKVQQLSDPSSNFTLHLSFEIFVTSPENLLFSPINSATNEFTGSS